MQGGFVRVYGLWLSEEEEIRLLYSPHTPSSTTPYTDTHLLAQIQTPNLGVYCHTTNMCAMFTLTF